MTRMAADRMEDRRIKRTRSAILSAFNRLILERGYDCLTPGEVASAADVGRSTFYEHFKGMDGLLAETLAVVLSPLADGCFETGPPDAARRAVAHIWDNRRRARALLEGEAQGVVLRSFAGHFAAALRRVPAGSGSKGVLDPELIALQLAAGQLAVLGAWISGRFGHSAEEIAGALHVGGRAVVVALNGSPEGESAVR